MKNKKSFVYEYNSLPPLLEAYNEFTDRAVLNETDLGGAGLMPYMDQELLKVDEFESFVVHFFKYHR